MSWRDTLGGAGLADHPYTQKSHNAQKYPSEADSADIADSAFGDSEETHTKLLEVLTTVCCGLSITPQQVRAALAPEDIEDWRKGDIGGETFRAFARALVLRREMNQGIRPAHYNERATCKHCGPIWSWFTGEVFGCPWCWNRIADRPIPRPGPVCCADCVHFERINPHLGHCAKGEPENPVGLCASDKRICMRWQPLIDRTGR